MGKTLLVVVVIGVVAWFLFQKAEKTFTSVNKSVKSTYTAGTAASSVITNVAPALGTFLSGAAKSLFGGDDDDGGEVDLTNVYSSSSSHLGGDDLLEPEFA